MHTRVLRLVLSGLMGALLVVSKQAMSGLPNIEPVTLLIILFALELPRETPGAITVFLVLQGVLYGFGLWWAMYLYVWYLLAFLARLLRRMDENRAAVRLYLRLSRLAKALKAPVPRELTELAQKARFSQHHLTRQELQPLFRFRDVLMTELKKRSRLRRLWDQWILVRY